MSNEFAGTVPTGSPVGTVSADAPLLRLSGVVKRFGPVHALNGIDLDIPAGEVTALVGDNGAGKSSLIKAIAGIHPVDGGRMLWNGRPVRLTGPRAASALGIETVYQDLALCENLDIVQNMFLGREDIRGGVLLDEAAMETKANQTLRELSVTTVTSIRQLVASLSGGQRQAVAVARAVMWDAKLVIMDEPTAALGVSQTAMVLDLVKRLSSRGIAVLVVSHNLNDVFQVADRVAVMYLGRLARTAPVSELAVNDVVELITTGNLSKTA
ncbi:monosaccharide ABC transporter ATP-binding protein, CUT2 family [Paramicrobacterium humi]|uniref:Monosaccharide ABC transporter ATP-binding protein, CUT2 family n=1 Tax=Paramicrobacterium humi TaxID=640635 RepID=A0A1H4NXL8_9MICO|nr:ATP-binding cassette domain-containing protein [Microbacterium humi]SEB99889.1 monosaccharide ABC transporter ATP-binding protein, CUT2 family [Microbacterium humi]